MQLFLTKFVSALIYPMGVITVLVVLALLVWLFGKVRLARAFCLLAICVLAIASSPKTSHWLISYLENQYPAVALDKLPDAEIAVVLGGTLALPVKPRLYLELVQSSDRLLHAARIYRQGKVKRLFLTGGNVFDGYIEPGESVFAKQLLVEWGVPVRLIGVDSASKTTYENARNSRDYLPTIGINNQPIMLITSALHMPRAVATFRQAGITVIPVSTDILATEPIGPQFYSWLPSASALQGTTAAWHEIVGLWYYRFRGWAAD